MHRTITTAAHRMDLDPLYGAGLLTMPRPADDVRDPFGGPSLHEVEWHAVVRLLDSLGWEPHEDGLAAQYDVLPDGRGRLLPRCREPVVSLPTSREEADALATLGQS